jgi:hypothetical protein
MEMATQDPVRNGARYCLNILETMSFDLLLIYEYTTLVASVYLI